MQNRRTLKVLSTLLRSFPPSDWTEEVYIKTPPFVQETIESRVLLIPMKSDAERSLDQISSALGLKKMNGSDPSYIARRADTVKALGLFKWFVRMSWHDKEFAVVWALFNATGGKDQDSWQVSVQSITELTGLDPTVCGQTIRQVISGKANPLRTGELGAYKIGGPQLQSTLEKLADRVPTWTEELIMGALCSEMGTSVAEIYEDVIPHNLTVGAAYKTVERLKRDGYVYALRHFRVNDRGPMRELLSSDCRNCFYGYSNSQKCFDDQFRMLEDILQRYYGKRLNGEARTDLYTTLKSIPLSSRVMRKVLVALTLIHRADEVIKEGQVVTMLRKLEESYGVGLPVKAEPSNGYA